MDHEAFLVGLDLSEKRVLVVGGDGEALLRTRNLARAGARVTLVWPTFSEEVRTALALELAEVEVLSRMPRDEDLDGCWLVVLAEQSDELARTLGLAAKERRVFFCAIDQPAQNTFAHVGIARAGKLQLGISTSGAVPGIAGALKREFQGLLDRSDFAKIVEKLDEVRRTSPPEKRGALLRKLASKIVLRGSLAFENDEEKS